jgi:hypothetical protein
VRSTSKIKKKEKLLIITFVIVAQMSFGQVTKNLGDFSDIKVFDKLKVELISSQKIKQKLPVIGKVKWNLLIKWRK